MRTLRSLFVTLTLTLIGAGASYAATGTIDFTSTAPTITGYDIGNLTDNGSPNGNQDYTNNAPPGQTFTTETNPLGYLLTGISLQGSGGSSYVGANYSFTLTIYSVSGTMLTSLGSEAFTVPNPAPSGFTSDYLTMTFTTPFALSADTEYAFTFANTSDSTTAGNPQAWYGLTESSGNVYNGGTAFNATEPTVEGASTTIKMNDSYDRDFVVDLVPEPSTWAMMIGGFAVLFGFQKFRRRMI